MAATKAKIILNLVILISVVIYMTTALIMLPEEEELLRYGAMAYLGLFSLLTIGLIVYRRKKLFGDGGKKMVTESESYPGDEE